MFINHSFNEQNYTALNISDINIGTFKRNK